MAIDITLIIKACFEQAYTDPLDGRVHLMNEFTADRHIS